MKTRTLFFALIIIFSIPSFSADETLYTTAMVYNQEGHFQKMTARLICEKAESDCHVDYFFTGTYDQLSVFEDDDFSVSPIFSGIRFDLDSGLITLEGQEIGRIAPIDSGELEIPYMLVFHGYDFSIDYVNQIANLVSQ